MFSLVPQVLKALLRFRPGKQAERHEPRHIDLSPATDGPHLQAAQSVRNTDVI